MDKTLEFLKTYWGNNQYLDITENPEPDFSCDFFLAIRRLMGDYHIERTCEDKPVPDTEANEVLPLVSVSTSKDYKRLFKTISKGIVVPCFVDYDWRDGSTPSRDIAKVRRFKENDIQIGARGIQYGGVEDFLLHGRTEFEAFAEECNRMNLEYCL